MKTPPKRVQREHTPQYKLMCLLDYLVVISNWIQMNTFTWLNFPIELNISRNRYTSPVVFSVLYVV